MEIESLLKQAEAAKSWSPEKPTPDLELESFLTQCELTLPSDYIDLLRSSNGGLAILKHFPDRCLFFPVSSLLQWNKSVPKTKSLFVFGTNATGIHMAFKYDQSEVDPNHWTDLLVN